MAKSGSKAGRTNTLMFMPMAPSIVTTTITRTSINMRTMTTLPASTVMRTPTPMARRTCTTTSITANMLTNMGTITTTPTVTIIITMATWILAPARRVPTSPA